MDYFVEENSIVRKIWGKSDTILFIFAGASAEFALNKAVDWLYFTGKLPADPIGRLFSTVSYAKAIVFASKPDAESAINRIKMIHKQVEINRGHDIPDWAYRDVLYMLIYYSIASFELLERKLTIEEKEDVYRVFYRVGSGMGVKDLPDNYELWIKDRDYHLEHDLQNSPCTTDLFKQYKKQLEFFRYGILLEAQKLLLPSEVSALLFRRTYSLLAPLIPLYNLCRRWNLDFIFKEILLPQSYKKDIKNLDVV